MLFILALFGATAWAQPADLAIVNARVYTLDPARPQASAIAVRGARILAVGDDLSGRLTPQTRRIDAKGATVVPGLIDSHAHMRSLGDSLEVLNLREARSADEVARLVREAAARRPPGDWIRGRGWDQSRWPGGTFPTASPLNSAAPEHPVFLTRVDGHAAWVNAKALALADINRATPDPAGGKILREAGGAPTGILIDRAQGLVSRKIPPPTQDQVRDRIARAARECARLGLTTIHDAGVDERDLKAYRELIAAGGLPVRVYAMIGGEGDLWRQYLERGPEMGEFLTVRSIKLMADGALGSRGAALKAPYADDPDNRGLAILSRQDIERVARAAVKRGFQVNTHAIGDAANRTVLDAYGAALGGANDKRFRVEHAQVVSLEDIPLFRKYSVLASMQATHATSDMAWAEQRLGRERLAGAYAWQRFLELGVPVANGSDFPVENADPLWGFYASVARQDHDGKPQGGWYPDQRMSRQQALRSWTLAGAEAAFEERDKGSLEAGKLADFVVLSRDVLTIPAREILETRVVMSVVGGRIVHSESQ